MKTKKFTAVVAGTALLANLAIFAFAGAADTDLSVGVTAGTEPTIVSAYDDASFTSVAVSTSNQSTTASLSNLHWRDLDGDTNGFKIYAQSTVFTGASTAKTIQTSNLALKTGAGANVTNNISNANISPSCVTGYTYTTSDATLADVAEGDTQSAGVDLVIKAGATGVKYQDCKMEAAAAGTATLNVPMYQPLDSYSGVLTLTIQEQA